MDKADVWRLTHQERAAMADTLEEVKPSQWAEPSLVRGWSIQDCAAHILAGAEQTKGGFAVGMIKAGGRFNLMIDRDAKRLGKLPPAEIIRRLRARTTTTNGPGAPAEVLLGEIVVHGGDIRYPLGMAHETKPEAMLACFENYKGLGFPLGVKQRIAGLRLIATDAAWSYGAGPEVTGPALPLLLAMTGRGAGLAGLDGAGLDTLRAKMA
jgi:uncharacterized protein (TIGR03083 family)